MCCPLRKDIKDVYYNVVLVISRASIDTQHRGLLALKQPILSFEAVEGSKAYLKILYLYFKVKCLSKNFI